MRVVLRVFAREARELTLYAQTAVSSPHLSYCAMPLRDSRLNSPSEMLVRAVFAGRYLFFFGGLFMSAVALHEGSLNAALKAVVLFAGMGAGHWWLKSRDKLKECDRALEGMFRGGAATEDNDGLDALLRRRDALEERRGRPGFDPWEVHAVRREIRDYLREHPESADRPDVR